MRFLLLLLPWCFLLSLVRADPPPGCNWKMPTAPHESCEQIIKWKVNDDKQATSTCLEYFATTFVTGVMHGAKKDQVKCTVLRQFECHHVTGSVSIFDKCYKFLKKADGTVIEKSMTEYISLGHTDALCGADGALPIFFSLSQGKHIAMEAHRRDIERLWVNVNKDGKTIDEPTNPKNVLVKKDFLLYKDLWKVEDGVYWKGDKLAAVEKVKGVNQPIPPAENADYLFFRSRTDYVHNLWQGSFERATEATKAGIVCEYPAKIVPDVKHYCAKMGKDGLGMNAMYDSTTRMDRKRCVYSTLTKYSMKGTKAAIEKFPGCAEKPSNEHSAGLDDGTADKEVYRTVTAGGTYRIAAIKLSTELSGYNTQYKKNIRKKCDQSAPTHFHRMPYKVFDHFLKEEFVTRMTTDWDPAYPKDECSDFPNGEMDSNTLAIRKNAIIDVPVPVRLPALCSIEADVDCNLNPNICTRTDLLCTKSKSWNEVTKLYAQCGCARGHIEGTETINGVPKKVCKWTGGGDKCGVMHSYNEKDPQTGALKICDYTKEDCFYPLNAYRAEVVTKIDQNIAAAPYNGEFSDKIDRVLVRNGCKMTVWSHPPDHQPHIPPYRDNYKLLEDVGYGEHLVPNDKAGTLNGWDSGMSSSAIDCTCHDPK